MTSVAMASAARGDAGDTRAALLCGRGERLAGGPLVRRRRVAELGLRWGAGHAGRGKGVGRRQRVKPGRQAWSGRVRWRSLTSGPGCCAVEL
jgi:hypothetical protein